MALWRKRVRDMPKHFDPALAEALELEVVNGMPLNPVFGKSHTRIAERLADRSYSDRYDGDSRDRDLFERCVEHAEANSKSITSDGVIVLVHPFYLHTSHGYASEFSSSMKNRVDRYFSNLLSILTNSGRRQIVVLETAHHYAAVTSTLLKRDVVDRVIFTESDSGKPMELSDLSILDNRALFFGGGYIGRCLNTAFYWVHNTTVRIEHENESMFFVDELCVASPHDTPTLRIRDYLIPQDNIVSFEALIQSE